MFFPGRLNYSISIEKQGAGAASGPRRPAEAGRYTEIRTPEYEFRFNLNGEIKSIRGLTTHWPHPFELLKRTDGNDWVYYSVGDKSGEDGVKSWTGEYYLPCLPYPSNPVWEFNYFSNPDIMSAFGAWSQLYATLYEARQRGAAMRGAGVIDRILAHHEQALFNRAQELQSIIGGRVSVLPPDARHADYEVIPLTVADGCLYHCGFCCIQSRQRFRPRSEADILDQARRLKAFYGRNLENYSALFLGHHDALAAGAELIRRAAREAHAAFGFGGRAAAPKLFLFGSVDSLLRCDDAAFETLNRLPFYTYINIGLESADAATLAQIRKPLDPSGVRAAFHRMSEVNETFSNIEMTGNFLLGRTLSPDHYASLARLLGDAPSSSRGKGGVYLSPLKDSPKKRALLPRFFEIKAGSRLPAYVYLIQRL